MFSPTPNPPPFSAGLRTAHGGVKVQMAKPNENEVWLMPCLGSCMHPGNLVMVFALLATKSWNLANNSRRRCPLSLYYPLYLPKAPIVSGHNSQSLPTLLLKSPSRISLSNFGSLNYLCKCCREEIFDFWLRCWCVSPYNRGVPFLQRCVVIIRSEICMWSFKACCIRWSFHSKLLTFGAFLCSNIN